MTSFREEQRFRQLWVWILILGGSLVPWVIAWQQLIRGRPVGDNPAPDHVMLILLVVVGIALPIMFYNMRLIVEVREDGVYLRFWPFHLREQRFAFEDIERSYACTYRPIRDYGGWGIRFGRKGKAYNVSGDRGVQLALAKGRRVLIGSQRPEALAEAIEAGRGVR